MSKSKIEDIIDEIEAYIDDCKTTAFSSNKIIVNKDDLDGLLSTLRSTTPEEIKQYQRMVANREQILAAARAKADEIVNAAQIHTNELVSEHQIMQQAYAQANEVILIAQKNAQEKIDRATEDANNIRMGAINYTDELLANIQTILVNSVETTRSRDEQFLATMQAYLDTVEANRAALLPETVESDDVADEEPTKEKNESPKAKPEAPEKPTVTVVEKQETKPAANDDDDLPALDIPDTFFNKE